MSGSNGVSEKRRNIFVVLTNCEQGSESEFNRWYEEHHVPEVLRVEGFVAVQRFALSPDQRPGSLTPQWQYLAVYEIEGEVTEIHRRFAEAAPSFVKTSSLAEGTAAWVFSPLGERVTRSDR